MLKKGLIFLGLLVLPGCGQGPGAPVIETTIQLSILAPGGAGSGSVSINNHGGSSWSKDFAFVSSGSVTDFAYSNSTAQFSVTFTSAPVTFDYTFGPNIKVGATIGPVTVTGVVANPDYTSSWVNFQ